MVVDGRQRDYWTKRSPKSDIAGSPETKNRQRQHYLGRQKEYSDCLDSVGLAKNAEYPTYVCLQRQRFDKEMHFDCRTLDGRYVFLSITRISPPAPAIATPHREASAHGLRTERESGPGLKKWQKNGKKMAPHPDLRSGDHCCQ